MKKSQIAAALGAAILGSGIARAGTFVWTGSAGDGNWFTANNWSPNGMPGAGDSATVSTGTTATINATLTDTGGSILASGAGSVVSIGSSGSIIGGTLSTASGGLIAGNGGTLDALSNTGTVTFNSSFLYLEGTIDNTGVIEADSSAGVAYLRATSGQNTTLSGGGSILLNKSNANLQDDGEWGFINQDNLIHGFGDINAYLANAGTVSADSNGNTLTIDGVAKTNTGTFSATNGGTLLIGTTVTGGTFTTSTGGIITASSGGILSGINNAGTLTFNSNFLYLQGTINNTGVIEADSSSGVAYLRAVSGQTTTLSGGGSVLLNKSNATILDNGGWGFINQDNLIHGFGDINATLTNDATVSADSSGNTLTLDGAAKINNGTIQAINGGTLLIGTEITGGTLNTSTGGIITSTSGGILNNLTNAGTLTFNSNFLYLQGTINNTGVIEADSSSGVAYLRAVSGQTTTLSGGGSVLLNKSNATILDDGGWGFINQDNLIHGFGDINATLTNNGTVSADSSGNTLTLDGPAKINTGTLQATSGGILNINSVMTNTGASIQATGAGSVVSIGGSGAITGGTLSTASGGLIAGNGGTLNGLTNSGTVTFNSSILYLQGTIDNTGVIESDSSVSVAYLRAVSGQTTTLSGGGSVLLNKNNATILDDGGWGFINQDNLIHGFGTIGATLTNNGTVTADSNGNTLTLNGPAITNTGTFSATNGGTLLIGTEITGGTMNSASGGIVTGNGSGILNNLTNAGTLTFDSNFLYLQGTINNTGVIESDSSVSVAFLRAVNGQTTTLSGDGSVLLNKNNATILDNGGWGFINQNNLIHGFGDINATLTNNGTVSADSSGNTLTIDGTPKTNNGTLQATSGGVLQISSITVTQGAGGDIVAGTVGSAGTVSVTNAAIITGGDVSSVGSGAFNVVSGTLTSVTIPSGSQVNVPASGILHFSSLTNNGTLSVTGTATGGALSGTGTVSIASSGVVHLSPSTGLSQQGGLSISGGVLDIANNHMIISYGATDPVATIYGYLKTGFASHAWNGPGIDSITAASNAQYGVGFVDGADGVPGANSAPGVPLTSGQILIAYALYGDVNLDGLVNATDFAIFGANFNTAVTGWDKGDFTYSGLINATDFAMLGSNFGKSAVGASVALPSADYAALDAFAAANGLALPSVPEPACGAIVLMTAGALVRRRRVSRL